MKNDPSESIPATKINNDFNFKVGNNLACRNTSPKIAPWR